MFESMTFGRRREQVLLESKSNELNVDAFHSHHVIEDWDSRRSLITLLDSTG